MSEERAMLECEMENGCAAPVTMIDNKGYIYCTEHGLKRRDYRPCRQLRKHEINRLKRGERLLRY